MCYQVFVFLLLVCSHTAFGQSVYSPSEIPAVADEAAQQKNMIKAFNLYSFIIKDGSYSAQQVMKAQNAIGSYYEQGLGVVANADSAKKYYAAAAFTNQNYYWKLAIKYHNENNFDEAFKATKTAADLDNSKNYLSRILLGITNYDVALCYFNGSGTPVNNEAGIAYLKKAGDVNFPEALIMLGQDYETGHLVAKNIDEAVAWYKKAAACYDADIAKQGTDALQRLGR